MKAVFLSDVHLKDPEGADYERLICFFDRLRGRRGSGSGEISDATLTLDQLVIAGDFFDFWFSKGDDIYPGFRPIVDRMVALKQEGDGISDKVSSAILTNNCDLCLLISGPCGFQVLLSHLPRPGLLDTLQNGIETQPACCCHESAQHTAVRDWRF